MTLMRKLFFSNWTDGRLPKHLEQDFNETVKDLGLPYATDLTCGDPAGAAPIANTRQGQTRIDACE